MSQQIKIDRALLAKFMTVSKRALLFQQENSSFDINASSDLVNSIVGLELFNAIFDIIPDVDNGIDKRLYTEQKLPFNED